MQILSVSAGNLKWNICNVKYALCFIELNESDSTGFESLKVGQEITFLLNILIRANYYVYCLIILRILTKHPFLQVKET